MRAEVTPHEDTTTLYLRWEIFPEGPELNFLRNIGGPIVLRIAARDYVDTAGTYHESTDVDVPIYPHAGTRNFGQAKFTSYEARRAFLEALQGGVTNDVANFLFDAEPGSVPIEGHAVRVGAPAEKTAE